MDCLLSQQWLWFELRWKGFRTHKHISHIRVIDEPIREISSRPWQKEEQQLQQQTQNYGRELVPRQEKENYRKIYFLFSILSFKSRFHDKDKTLWIESQSKKRQNFMKRFFFTNIQNIKNNILIFITA